jgi:hypothetical protein
MPRHQLTLLALLAGCSPSTPPTGPCSSSADCPTDWICLFQHCTSPATITENLSAVVYPSDPSLAPQQYQPFELNPSGGPQSSIAIVMHQPQQLLGQFVLPPGCNVDIDAGRAFPVHLSFIGTSVIPGQAWQFNFASDYQGNVDGVLPLFQTFQQNISPSSSCAPPVLGTHRVLAPGPFDVGKYVTFPSASESLQLLGIVTNADGLPTDGGPIGTLVSILPADPSGQQLSIAVPVEAGGAFDLQIPYAQAGPAPLALLTLSVRPSKSGLSNYPSILMPFQGLIVDAGQPTPQVVSVDGGPLVLALPYEDSNLVDIEGTTETPIDGGNSLPGATVQISSQSLTGCFPDAGSCSFFGSIISDQNGSFSFMRVPAGSYSLTVIPEYPSSLLWFPTTVQRDCLLPGDCSLLGLPLVVTQGFEISGWVTFPRPNTQPFDDQGQVALYSLPDMQVLSSVRLALDGGFSLFAPPGRAMLIVTPDAVTGYPSTYQSLPEPDVVAPEPNIVVNLLPPGLLTGTVSVEALDAGPSVPVPGAAIFFYYVVSDPADPDGGEFAIPITNGVTDALGNFSVIGPPIALPPTQ